MDINNRHHLHAVARDRLEKAPQAPKIALIYGGIVVGATLVSTGITYLLNLQINKFGGLSNMGIRSILSTFSTMLPFLVNFLLLGLELGFLNANLRISRNQFASPQSLKLGFSRFWLLLKTLLLQSGLYLLASMASMYLASNIFMFTPLSRGLTEILGSATGGAATPQAVAAIMEDPAIMAQMSHAMIPMFVIMLVILVALCIPLAYFYRMTSYVIIDKPHIPALLALRSSRTMMRHNCRKMFRLDLTMWWYYLAMILSTLLCYGDLLLGAFGVQLPMSPSAASFLFQGIYLLANFAIIVFLRPHVTVSYALAYDSLRPQDPPQQGAVLGNIFNM